MDKAAGGPRYPADTTFGPADAAVYRAMLGHLRPARVLAVGPGYPTALALAEADTNPELSGLEISCIEPPVQQAAPTAFERLESWDILFIDSKHVVEAGSDVVWLVLHVLPRLARGVVVHIHDVFWPFQYPAHLLHAFLAGNDSWEILFFSSWIWRCQPQCVPPRLAQEEPGSIWLRKVR